MSKHFRTITTEFNDPDNFEDSGEVYRDEDECTGECLSEIEASAFNTSCGETVCKFCGARVG